ncbi:uncharacterized protein TM35_000112830 [Trypanosoma theileri]|uniref:Uncharacterized protein n=1 Tax=Trypanosoma theileri TaxID=67003 RepID=A0A1X0NZV8_9TRYP|nr:uncharacterized protein TM35_000112830 [Trypanosoma theileri]ORC89749.1 hypothetical protein TM35_000112830 [Trypanosoma theileri]
MSASPSSKMRNRMQELEDEVNFLREQNYHIQRLSDTYRERVSRLVAAIQFKSHTDTPLAFPTVKDLEDLVGRLRSRDIPQASSSSLSPPLECKETENTPKKLLSRENDDGLMQSTSSLSHLTAKEEENVKACKGGKSKSSGKKSKSPHTTTTTTTTTTEKNTSAQGAQRSIIARLTAENKNLASLVDTLKLHLSTATQVNSTLRKKLRSLSSFENSSHSSPSGQRYNANTAASNKSPGSSPLQKKLKNLEEENERLRSVVENGEQVMQEVLHYKTLLQRKGAEVEAIKRREENTMKELNSAREELSKATETIRSLGTALKLSKIREKRAVSAKGEVQKKKKEEQEQQQQESPYQVVEKEEQEKQEKQKQENQRMELFLSQKFTNDLTNYLSTLMTEHHTLYGEHLFLYFVIHLAFAQKIINGKKESILQTCIKESFDKNVMYESFMLLLDELIEQIRCDERNAFIKTTPLTSTLLNMDRNEKITGDTNFMGENKCKVFHLDSNTSEKLATLNIPFELRRSDIVEINDNTLVEEDEEEKETEKEIHYEGSHIATYFLPSAHHAMLDAATITLSPIQISRAVGRSLPVSPIYTNEYTETISPVLISRAVGTSPFNEVVCLPQVYSTPEKAEIKIDGSKQEE